MRQVLAAIGVIAGVSAVSLACEETRCREVSASVVDETRHCLRPAISIPELQACTPYPPTRGVRIICLVDSRGQLHLGSAGDSERVSGSGWRYSDAAGSEVYRQPKWNVARTPSRRWGFQSLQSSATHNVEVSCRTRRCSNTPRRSQRGHGWAEWHVAVRRGAVQSVSQPPGR